MFHRRSCVPQLLSRQPLVDGVDEGTRRFVTVECLRSNKFLERADIAARPVLRKHFGGFDLKSSRDGLLCTHSRLVAFVAGKKETDSRGPGNQCEDGDVRDDLRRATAAM